MSKHQKYSRGSSAASQSAISASELSRLLKKFRAELSETDRRVMELERIVKAKKAGSSSQEDDILESKIDEVLRNLHERSGGSKSHSYGRYR